MNRSKYIDRGFTLIELIVGLLILSIVSGLALNAFINASKDFSQDKKTIDSSQNLSAILEIIGNDIKQAGEQISDANFPIIEFKLNTDAGSRSGSSKIIVRRALLPNPLTLCQNIAANTNPTTISSLLVADNTDSATVSTDQNCDVGNSSNPLLVSRTSKDYTASPPVEIPGTNYTTNPLIAIPTPSLALLLPTALRDVRDYRCKLDDLNPTVAYDDSTMATTDFCGAPSATQEKIRVAVSDRSGRILIFNQTGETADAANTATAKKFAITLNTTFLASDVASATNTKNTTPTISYQIGSPIYIIEEREYYLDNTGTLNVRVNEEAPSALVKKIQNFQISARGYTNATDRRINPTPPVPTADICASSPAAGSATESNPQYICKLNYDTAATTMPMNWKFIAGVKVELQAEYDATGRAATASAADTEKLRAAAEFFPRNVLSK